MLLQSDEKLDELIVKVLGHESRLTAESIRTQMAGYAGKTYSSQAVFKELSNFTSSCEHVRTIEDESPRCLNLGENGAILN